MDSFDSMFDFNHDGALDRGEKVLQYEFLEAGERKSASHGSSKRRRKEEIKLSDILIIAGLSFMILLYIFS